MVAERFRASTCDQQHHKLVQVAPDLASLLTACELTLFATVVARPHVHDPRLLSHQLVILHISLRDLAPELLLNACNVVDDVDHLMRARFENRLSVFKF
jgi:N-[(2S)-2-amino-2-carboxyethyl]-L-glutamate dehydrogenase